MDLEKYQGLWYEISKIPFKWEAVCTRATAYYQYDKIKNTLSIENSCWKNNEIFGTRKAIGIPVQPFLLKVLFNDGLPNDGWGDYLVEYTDYINYAIVGSPSKEHLWILARKMQITAAEYNKLLDIIYCRGYPLYKLKINII